MSVMLLGELESQTNTMIENSAQLPCKAVRMEGGSENLAQDK
jgi:hypothetical protein